MTLITLTAEERNKFGRWLLQEAQQEKQILEQLKKLVGTTPIETKMKLKIEREITAIGIVAVRLLSTEEMTLEGTHGKEEDL